MAVTADTIHGYFNEYGWHFEYDPDNRTWLTGFRGNASNFNVLVHLAADWLYFIITPFVNAPEDDACARKLYLHLLRVNHAINMAKFSIDADGDVVLTVELPTENLAYSEFSDGINALSYYADEHYTDVFSLSRNPDYQATLPEPDLEVDPWRPPSDDTAPN